MTRRMPMLVTMLCGLGLACAAPSTTESRAASSTAAVQEFYDGLAGQWTGSYSLWLHAGSEAQVSETIAKGRSAPGAADAWLDYSWSWKGAQQAGTFFLRGSGMGTTSSWTDSWHMADEPMECESELLDDGRRLVLLGSYPVGPGQPDWGWRTEFTLVGPDELLMEAYNISPDGHEELAVRAEWNR